jgi:anti-sigma B factor antagonist
MSNPQPRKRMEINVVGEVRVIRFCDKTILDEQNVNGIGDELFRLVDDGARRIVIDLGPTVFLSSEMLQKLLALHDKLLTCEGALVLCAANRVMQETLRLPGSRVKEIPYAADTEAALELFV